MTSSVIVTVYPPPAVAAVALSEPIAGVGQGGGVAQGVTYGKVTVQELNPTTATNALFDRMWMRSLRRNANAAAARMSHDYGLAPGFHHLVDPATAKEQATLIFEDWAAVAIAAGACDVAIGLHEHITPADASTLVGVGFRCGADLIWHSFVNDCPTNVAPVTVRRDVALGVSAAALHRLTIVVDGPSKTISWLIDGVTVDTWSPPATLDQMTAAGPKVQWSAVVPALGDATILFHGGGLPNVRLLVL